MIVNFRTREISRNTRKLTRTLTLIKKNNNNNNNSVNPYKMDMKRVDSILIIKYY